MTQSTFNEDSGEGKGKKRKSSKTDIIKRMLRSYKERKRKEKIAKLMSSNDHWKGLSQTTGKYYIINIYKYSYEQVRELLLLYIAIME